MPKKVNPEALMDAVSEWEEKPDKVWAQLESNALWELVMEHNYGETTEYNNAYIGTDEYVREVFDRIINKLEELKP